jgi:hypothetical protein
MMMPGTATAKPISQRNVLARVAGPCSPGKRPDIAVGNEDPR